MPCRSLAPARSLLRDGSPAGRVAWLFCRFHAVISRRASPPRSMCLKRFNRCGVLSNHPSIACGDAMPFNPIGFILSLLACSVIFLVGLLITCERMVRCRVLRPACLVGRRPAPLLVPPFRHPARRTGRGWRGVVACLPVRLIGPVAVFSCGRAVSLYRSGSLP